jgi:hypothetical protein
MAAKQTPGTISPRQLRRLAAEQREQDAAAETALANAVLRDDAGKPTGIQSEALPFISHMARSGASTAFIASRLGLSAKQFKTLIGPGDKPTALRLAFERGHVDFERDIGNRLLKHGEKWAPALMFFAKTQLRWSETQSVVDIRNEDNRRIQISLPDALPLEQLMKTLGQTEILDGRKNKSIPLRDVTPAFARVGMAQEEPIVPPVETLPEKPLTGLALIQQKQGYD